MSGRNENFDDSAKAPTELVRALRELPQERIFVPRTLDEAVLRAARKHLAGENKRRVGWFRLMPWTVAVALLALVLLLAEVFTSKLAKQRAPAFALEDVNHNGRVDILDAFALAKQIRTQSVTSARWDMNGDGVVDERDVAVIAARAVRLAKGGHS